MQDARGAVVAMVAACGDEKVTTKHLKAWAEGRSPSVKPPKKKLTEKDMEEMRQIREQMDKAKKTKG